MKVKKLSKKYFEPIPQGNTPRKVHTVEPEQLGERRLMVKKDVTTPHVIAVYHVPEANSPELLFFKSSQFDFVSRKYITALQQFS